MMGPFVQVADSSLSLGYSWKVWAVCIVAVVLLLLAEAATRFFR